MALALLVRTLEIRHRTAGPVPWDTPLTWQLRIKLEWQALDRTFRGGRDTFRVRINLRLTDAHNLIYEMGKGGTGVEAAAHCGTVPKAASQPTSDAWRDDSFCMDRCLSAARGASCELGAPRAIPTGTSADAASGLPAEADVSSFMIVTMMSCPNAG